MAIEVSPLSVVSRYPRSSVCRGVWATQRCWVYADVRHADGDEAAFQVQGFSKVFSVGLSDELFVKSSVLPAFLEFVRFSNRARFENTQLRLWAGSDVGLNFYIRIFGPTQSL